MLAAPVVVGASDGVSCAVSADRLVLPHHLEHGRGKFRQASR